MKFEESDASDSPAKAATKKSRGKLQKIEAALERLSKTGDDSPFPTSIDLNKHIKMVPKPDSRLTLSKASQKMIEDSQLFSSISNVLESGDKELGVDELRKKAAPPPKFSGLPGWGNWANSRTIHNADVVAPPKVRHEEIKKKRVYVKDDVNKSIHQVVDVPFPFTSVKDYESSIRVNFSQEFGSRRVHNLLAKSKKKVDMELDEK